MESLIKYKSFKVLKYIFIIVSLISVVYATYTMRGLYNDGTYYMINILNNMAANNYTPVVDNTHPRQLILIFIQIPIWICNILHLYDKFFLMRVFTFAQMLLPLLVLYWNYKLSQRTNRPDIFFWHLFVYCLILIPSSIFSVVESIIGAGFSFILWNYLVNNIQYRKRDIFAIVFLLICMFGTYEYNIFLGIIFFLAGLKIAQDTEYIKPKIVKMTIAIGSLIASFYNVVYLFAVKSNNSEIARFVVESGDFVPKIFKLCSSLSVAAIIFMLIFCFKKKLIEGRKLWIISLYFLAILGYLLYNLKRSLIPIFECHFRTIVCWALPLIFVTFAIYNDRKPNITRYSNFILIALLCGIFQNMWQLVDTYYWQRNIAYVEKELNNSKELLYIPEKHKPLSSTLDREFHRYIWHGTYPALSILLSKDYELKTMLAIYHKPIDGYIPLNSNDLYANKSLSIPALNPQNYIDLKNRYWDVYKCSVALGKYNYKLKKAALDKLKKDKLRNAKFKQKPLPKPHPPVKEKYGQVNKIH